MPEATPREHAQMLANLHAFTPLHKEEIHFPALKDDPIEFIHQIQGMPLWMDVEKSGTYLTTLNIDSKLFRKQPSAVEPFINPTRHGRGRGHQTPPLGADVAERPGVLQSLSKN